MRELTKYLGLPTAVYFLLLTLLVACKMRPSGPGEDYLLQNAWADKNAASIHGIKGLSYRNLTRDDWRRGQAARLPWTTKEWALGSGGLAQRWLAQSEGTQYEDLLVATDDIRPALIDDYLASPTENHDAERLIGLSPLEKYDLATEQVDFAATRAEIRRSLQGHQNASLVELWRPLYERGWASAAQLIEEPQVAVAIKRTDEADPLVFFPEDINALMVKSFTENRLTSEPRVYGLPCRADQLGPLAHDSWLAALQNGRPQKKRTVDVLAARWPQTDLQPNNDALVIDSADGTAKWLRFARWIDQETRMAEVSVARFSTNEQGLLAAVGAQETMAFHYGHHCADTDPAAFHLGLVRLMSLAAARAVGQALPLAIDLRSDNAVQSFPILSFDTQIGALSPLRADEKSLSEVALPAGEGSEVEPLILSQVVELEDKDARDVVASFEEFHQAAHHERMSRPAAKAQDPLQAWRHASTSQIAHVITRVDIVYPSFANAKEPFVGQMYFYYILEFDSASQLVGGHWSNLKGDDGRPLAGEALLLALNTEVADGTWSVGDRPLRIWSYPQDAVLTSRCNAEPCLSASFLKRIWQCSQNRSPDLAQVANWHGEFVPVADCPLN